MPLRFLSLKTLQPSQTVPLCVQGDISQSNHNTKRMSNKHLLPMGIHRGSKQLSVMSLENRPVRIKVQEVKRREKERGT